MRDEPDSEKTYLLQSIINFSNDAIISKSLEGFITSWNKGAENIFGYKAEEVIGKHVSILIPQSLVDEEQKIIAQIKAGKPVTHYETQRIKKNGESIDISLTVSPIKNEAGQITGASKIARDITERRLTDTALKKSRQEIIDYKYALDESCMVAMADKDGVITYVNDNFCKTSKFSRDELVGQYGNIINSGHHDEAFVRDMWQAISHGNIWKGEVMQKAKDGSYYWVDTTVVPFLDNEGKPYQYLATRYDITSRKEAEEALIKLNLSLEQKVLERTAELDAVNKELESFSYSVAHDLRAPLRIINGYADILKGEYKEKIDAEGERLINVIVNNTRRMGKLIDAILHLARMGRQELAMHETDMNKVVQLAIEELTEGSNIPVTFTVAALPHSICDAALIGQVWSNLLSNAMKYSSKCEHPVIEISAVQNENYITYTVRDNGVGFDMQYADKLFGVFQRLHKQSEYEGTGVGLAFVQRVISRHKGFVWAEAELNKGAAFHFNLPITRS